MLRFRPNTLVNVWSIGWIVAVKVFSSCINVFKTFCWTLLFQFTFIHILLLLSRLCIFQTVYNLHHYCSFHSSSHWSSGTPISLYKIKRCNYRSRSFSIGGTSLHKNQLQTTSAITSSYKWLRRIKFFIRDFMPERARDLVTQLLKNSGKWILNYESEVHSPAKCLYFLLF